MARKALCVGIDHYPGRRGELRGCRNDARGWAELLVDHYDFACDDVRVLLDEQATRRAMLAALAWLFEGARGGDVLVVTNSSHGTYVPDSDGAEIYDEALCPYDYRSNLVLDDEIRERIDALPRGVHTTFVSDSCHSGTVSRASRPEHARRARFLAPEEWGGASCDSLAGMLPRRAAKPARDAVVLAACRPSQYAWDADFGASYHGVLTWHALRAIRAAAYDLSWDALHARLLGAIAGTGIPQQPRLEASPDTRKRRLFS